VAAVGSFVLVAYAITFGGSPGPTAGDSTAFNVAADLRTGWLTDAAKVVTDLGSAAVTLPLAAIAGIVLGARRRWLELATLVAALAIIYIGVAVVKDAVARPRPLHPLTGYSGSAYPSGHAAHAAIYPWLALVAGRVLGRGWRWGTAALVAGVSLAAVVGLSRVYLHVHYLSDVSGGWGLGATAFALSAAVALVVGHVRQNSLADASPGDPPD
jgi:undecaprenyl-diphosphatase